MSALILFTFLGILHTSMCRTQLLGNSPQPAYSGWLAGFISTCFYLSKIWYRFHSKINNVLLTIKVESDGSVAFTACVFGGNFVIPSILCGHSGNLQSDVISCALWAWDKFIFSCKKQRKKHEQKITSYYRFILSWNKWEFFFWAMLVHIGRELPIRLFWGHFRQLFYIIYFGYFF